MHKTYYEKINGEFVPVSEYDSESFPKALVITKPGSVSRHYTVDPALLAAASFAKDKMIDTLLKASEMHYHDPLNQSQLDKLNEFMNSLDPTQRSRLTYASALDILDAGIDSMMNEANTMLIEHPILKLMWDKFMMTWKLLKSE